MSTPTAMRVLMIGYEKEALTAASEAFKRIQAYTKPDLSIETMALSRGFTEDTVTAEGGLHAYGFAGNSFIRLVKALRRGAKSLKRTPLEKAIISAQDPFLSGLLAYLLHRWTGVPFELQEHGDFFSPAWKNVHWTNQLWWWIGAILLRRASHVRVVSERVRDHVEALGVPRNRMTVLPVAQTLTALQARPLKKSSLQTPFRFVMPCRWTYQKGIDIAFRACTYLKQQNILFSLTLIGRGELAADITRSVQELQLGDVVTLAAWRSPDALWDEADALIVSSRWEGWCRTIPEAMAAGVNVISTPVGCVGSFFRPGQDGIEIPPEDPAALAEAMILLCKDVALQETFRHSARVQSLEIPKPYILRETQQDRWEALAA